MAKTVRADFFRVELPPDAPLFTDLLDRILAERPEPARRNLQFGPYWYRLELLEGAGQLRSGSFTRIRMDDLPHVAELAGETRDLELEQDEGLGEDTSFIYTQRYRVIVLQRNFQGVRPGTVEDYLTEITGTDLEFHPVIESDALQRLKRMKLVKRIDMSIATPTSPGVYRGVTSVQSVLEAATYVGAAQVSVSMGMGHRKGSLNVSRVKDAALRLVGFKNRGEDVRKIVVRGSRGLGDEPMESIDLLAHRLVEEFQVELENRQLPGPAVRLGLRGALSRQEDELRQQFGQGARR